jgi:hypothetical protein
MPGSDTGSVDVAVGGGGLVSWPDVSADFVPGAGVDRVLVGRGVRVRVYVGVGKIPRSSLCAGEDEPDVIVGTMTMPRSLIDVRVTVGVGVNDEVTVGIGVVV